MKDIVPAEVFYEHAALSDNDEETKALLLTAGNQAKQLEQLYDKYQRLGAEVGAEVTEK